MCLQGASRAGAEVLAAVPNAALRAHFVWVPMLPADNRAAARAAAQRFAHPRATHYWDRDRHLSRRMALALAIETRRSAAPGDDPPFAWDIYLAYLPGNRDIAAPDFWMHQLSVDRAPRLDADEWRRQIRDMLPERPSID
jgi:hypothetical protein